MDKANLGAVVVVGLAVSVGACSATPAEQRAAALRDDSQPRDWLCTEQASRRTVDEDEVEPELGFAPSEVLAFALGRHEVPLRWTDDSDVRLAAEAGSSMLEVEIEQSGDVVLFDAETKYTGHGATCEVWFEVPVRVTLRSEGGALDESFLATLRTRRADSAFIDVMAEGGALDGAFSAQLETEETELEPYQLYLTLGISRSNVSGGLEVTRWMATGAQETYELQSRSLAHFGPIDCARSELAVDLQHPTFGGMARSVIARVTELSELDVVWSDASVTTARAVFTPDAMGACVRPSFHPTATQAIVEVEGVLELRTEDGRLDGTYSVTALMHGDLAVAPKQLRVHVGASIYLSDAPTTPGELGFVEISASRVERPSLSLDLTILTDGTLSQDSSITLWSHGPPCDQEVAECTDDFEAAERGTFSR